jgi:hypothetical protein
MQAAWSSIRLRLDRMGIVLSGLCALHCIAGIVLVSFLGLGSVAGETLLAPAIHRVGLALAVAVAAATLGLAAMRHGQRGPLVVGAIGMALMFAGLFAPHGLAEALLTIPGVLLVASAHIWNLRLFA